MTRIGTITNVGENAIIVKKETLVSPLPTLKCSTQVQANKSVVEDQM